MTRLSPTEIDSPAQRQQKAGRVLQSKDTFTGAEARKLCEAMRVTVQGPMATKTTWTRDELTRYLRDGTQHRAG